MKESEFWELVGHEFGPSYGNYVVKTVHLAAIDSATAEQGLAAGISPKKIWEALCDTQDVPESRRLGPDKKR